MFFFYHLQQPMSHKNYQKLNQQCLKINNIRGEIMGFDGLHVHSLSPPRTHVLKQPMKNKIDDFQTIKSTKVKWVLTEINLSNNP